MKIDNGKIMTPGVDFGEDNEKRKPKYDKKIPLKLFCFVVNSVFQLYFRFTSTGSLVQIKVLAVICLAVGLCLVAWLMLESEKPVEDFERGKQILVI